MPDHPIVTISVVSHRQADLIQNLLHDLEKHCHQAIEVLLTLNVDETVPFEPKRYPFPVRIIENPVPKGYSANHNAAFKHARGEYFCVLNPDIRLPSNPFPELIHCFEDPRVAAAAPIIVDRSGAVEDSVRRFPTPWSILKKALGRGAKQEYEFGSKPFSPDWVAGMFMLFSADAFRRMGGFDEKYFLYYEDVDLCARIRLAGRRVTVCPAVSAVHDARRESHRSARYFRWHLTSILRYFLSSVFFRAVLRSRRASGV